VILHRINITKLARLGCMNFFCFDWATVCTVCSDKCLLAPGEVYIQICSIKARGDEAGDLVVAPEYVGYRRWSFGEK